MEGDHNTIGHRIGARDERDCDHDQPHDDDSGSRTSVEPDWHAINLRELQVLVRVGPC
jgi:hypothetical protein